ncbi:hypothetical protein GCM10007301_11590 [Azorhizobium oxalatiphilum]|uniref:Uncharacterized protein n=1 Tax=Azorhizobium oxalatiphilum TaxID=980631 RepID=A0A917BPD0_9HYPH|nr:hypothetical protein GCM10007301_11590 [Azorhizobium oxalatiphilum]
MARVGRHESGQQAQQRGLSSSRRTGESHEAAFGYGEIHVQIKRSHRTIEADLEGKVDEGFGGQPRTGCDRFAPRAERA